MHMNNAAGFVGSAIDSETKIAYAAYASKQRNAANKWAIVVRVSLGVCVSVCENI